MYSRLLYVCSTQWPSNFLTITQWQGALNHSDEPMTINVGVSNEN